MKKSLGDLFIVVFFISCIFIFGGWAFLNSDHKTSELENRKLAQSPTFTSDALFSGDYFKQFEKYYNDQFPLRDFWIETKASLEKSLLLQDVVNGVYISDDGFLISPVETRKDTLSPRNIAERVNQFAQKVKHNTSKVDVYFALTPNKPTIMAGKFPKYVLNQANSLSDKLISQFSHSDNVSAIDIRDAIKPHMDEPNMYFYTDHHWKAKAAYYSYVDIINEIRKNNTIEPSIEKDMFTWKESDATFYGSNARKTTATYAEQPDTVTIAKPKFKEKEIDVCFKGGCGRGFYDFRYLKLTDKYTNRYKVYMSGDFPEITIHNPNNKNGHNLLILKDSYANAMIQFLARNYSETRVLDLRHFKKKSINEYIKKNSIDEVLFIHNINSLITTPSLTGFNN